MSLICAIDLYSRGIELEATMIEAKTDALPLVNKFLPIGAAPLTERDFEIVPCLAVDNLINSHGLRFDLSELRRLVRQMPGTRFMADHDWEIENIHGFVFHASLVGFDPNAYIDELGFKKENQEIIDSEGAYAILASVAVPSDHPLLDRMKFGVQKLSVGGFSPDYEECPICKTSVNSEKCHKAQHIHWHWQLRDPAWRQLWEASGYTIVSHALYRKVRTIRELSLVWAGAVSSASIVNNKNFSELTIS